MDQTVTQRSQSSLDVADLTRAITDAMRRESSTEDRLIRRQQEEIRMRNALISAAPKYSGKGLLEPWLKRMRQYLESQKVAKEEWLNVARWCVEGDASQNLGALPVELDDFEDLEAALKVRYGRSK